MNNRYIVNYTRTVNEVVRVLANSPEEARGIVETSEGQDMTCVSVEGQTISFNIHSVEED